MNLEEKDFMVGSIFILGLLGTTLPLFFLMRAMDKAGVVSLRFTGEGFGVIRRDITTQVTWRDIEELRIRDRPIFKDGYLQGNLWEVHGSVGGRRFFFFHWLEHAAQEDEVSALLKLLVTEKTALMERQFQQGTSFKHKQLQADQNGITLNNQLVRWSDLTKPIVVAGQALFWRRDQATPIASLPLADDHVLVFFQVASRLATLQAFPETSHGRLLVRKPLRNERFYWSLAVLVVIWPLQIVFFTDGAPFILWSVLALPIGGYYLLRRPTRSVDIYDHAIVIRSNFKARTCSFKQITAIQWYKHRVFYKGSYTTSNYSIKLFVEHEPPLKLVFKAANPEEFFGLLQERALPHAFAHYKQTLEHTDSVAWGASARFTPDGLECTRGLFSSKTSLLPLDGQLEIKVSDEGVFLTHPNTGDTRFEVMSGELNFLPGYLLLEEKLTPLGMTLPPLP